MVQTKICLTCKKELLISAFGKNASKKDGLNDKCQECYKTYQRKWYKNNSTIHKHRVRKNSLARRAATRKKIFEYLEDHPCLCCGETDPIVLQFDHLRNKSFTISFAIQRGLSVDRIFKEIEKCQVLCANCHARKTARDFNWYKDLYIPEHIGSVL